MRTIAAVLIVAAVFAGGAQADILPNTWLRGASSVAVNDDATAVFLNPGGLALYPEQSLYVSYSTAGSKSAGGSAAVKLGSFGFGYDRQYLWEPYDDPDISGLRMGGNAMDTYTLGFAFGQSRSWGLGFDYRWFRPQFGTRKKSGTWDVGLMIRPSSVLSLGATLRNLSEPTYLSDPILPADCSCQSTTMSYVFGLAVRPFGNRLTLMADASVPRGWDWDEASYVGGLETEIMNGLILRGSMKSYRYEGAREEETSLGLWLGGTHVGAGASARSFTPSIDRVMTYDVLFTGQRMRSVIKPSHQVAEIKITGPLSDTSPGWSLFGGPEASAQRIVRDIRRAADQSSIDCILFRIKGLGRGFFGGPSALSQDIRDEIVRARDVKGKKIVVYLEHGASSQEYYLATAADLVVMNPASGIDGLGAHRTIMRFTGTTEKLGIEWDYMTAGKYKSTFHSLGPDSLTAEQRVEVQELVDSSYEAIVESIVEGRGIIRSKAEELCNGRLFTPPAALEAGLVDRLGFYEEAKVAAREFTGEKVPDDPDNIGVVSVRKWQDKVYDWTYGPTIAVVGAYGTIHEGKGGTDPVSGARSIGAETLVAALKKVRKDSRVKAVILRVDSGGGSGLASDIIWNETVKLAKEKPLIVSMADVAASGGYYIAVAAEKIFVQPLTITGSIGVMGMKPVLAELYDKIDATHETIKRGEHSDQWSLTRHLTEKELEMAQEAMEWFYDDFIEKASDSRGMSADRLRELAEGRVYVGARALELGLVDESGGLSATIDYACEKIGVKRERANIAYCTEKRSFFDRRLEEVTAGLGLHRFLSLGNTGIDNLFQLEATTDVLPE